MPGCQDQRSAAELAAVGQANTRDASSAALALEQQIHHPRAEAKLRPHSRQALTQRGDDLWQAVAANVRPSLRQDGLWCAVQRQDLQYIADVAALVCARVELAVAVRS